VTFEIDVPMVVQLKTGVRPLTHNDRMHWRPRAAKVATIRAVVRQRARSLHAPAAEHITVQLHYAPGGRSVTDAHQPHRNLETGDRRARRRRHRARRQGRTRRREHADRPSRTRCPATVANRGDPTVTAAVLPRLPKQVHDWHDTAACRLFPELDRR